MRRMGLAVAGALAGLLAVPSGGTAVTLEPIGGAAYDAPTFVTSDPTNPDRLFVTEQDGTIWEATPSGRTLFLDLTQETADPNGTEEGLWSIAFAPDFATTGLFYVAYSTAADHDPRLEEYRQGSTPAETEGTGRLVLQAEDNSASANHNGGQLQFGPDGYLYWSLGDDATSSNSQTLSNLRGKILRIDPRGAGAGDYTVPPGNPFAGAPGAQDEIWTLGLRNPWRFSFDRATGAMFIADVGAGSFEEIDRGAAGANYGWPTCEAFQGTNCSGPAFTPPIYAYANDAATCATIGGYVLRDSGVPELFGRYVFADLCDGDLWSIDPADPPALGGHRVEDASAVSPRSFGEDACGRLYLAAAAPGQVYRLEGASGGACPPSAVADTDPPETSLMLKRKNHRGSRYVARIRSDEPGSTFECKLDRRKWKPCGPKRRLRHLDTGRHRFRARATDAAGNRDPKPAQKRFRTKRR